MPWKRLLAWATGQIDQALRQKLEFAMEERGRRRRRRPRVQIARFGFFRTPGEVSPGTWVNYEQTGKMLLASLGGNADQEFLRRVVLLDVAFASQSEYRANKLLTAFRRCSSFVAMPMGGNEAEWLTRKNRIGTKLGSLNPAWQIIPWHDGLDTFRLTCHAATEFSIANGPAVYALFVNGVLLASPKPGR